MLHVEVSQGLAFFHLVTTETEVYGLAGKELELSDLQVTSLLILFWVSCLYQ